MWNIILAIILVLLAVYLNGVRVNRMLPEKEDLLRGEVFAVVRSHQGLWR